MATCYCGKTKITITKNTTGGTLQVGCPVCGGKAEAK